MSRILVVDDDVDNCTLLQLALTDNGHVAHAVASPKEAIAGAPAFNPDILVTDCCFDQRQDAGFQLARDLTQRQPGLPVIFLTGLPDYEVEKHMHGLANTRVFEKPLDLDAFLTYVRDLSGRARTGSSSA